MSKGSDKKQRPTTASQYRPPNLHPEGIKPQMEETYTFDDKTFEVLPTKKISSPEGTNTSTGGAMKEIS